MYKRQSFEASSTASSEAKDDYEEVLAAIQQELFSHSHMKDVSKSAPCMEITDKNATMIKSIGRSTKSLSYTFFMQYNLISLGRIGDELNIWLMDIAPEKNLSTTEPTGVLF
uniref:Uncharacterized protein n=1 Tax=Ditylenchus dipsaci TaxID=166011 RepID=A0A915DHT2_9BILA